MTPEIENHISANIALSKKRIMIANFLGGLAWGLGSVIGASVVVAIIVTILKAFNFIPGLKEFLDHLPRR